jgi:hypothetical protein
LAELAVTLVYHSAKAKFDMKQWIAVWMLGSIWGSSFLLIKIAVDELGVFPLVAIRVGIAGIIMLIYLGVTGRLLLKTRTDLLNVILAFSPSPSLQVWRCSWSPRRPWATSFGNPRATYLTTSGSRNTSRR